LYVSAKQNNVKKRTTEALTPAIPNAGEATAPGRAGMKHVLSFTGNGGISPMMPGMLDSLIQCLDN